MMLKKLIPKMLGGASDNIYNRIFDKWVEMYISNLVQRIRPSKILEIGVFKGRSAKLMIEAAKKAGVKKIEYYGFDTFEGPPKDEPNPKTEVSNLRAAVKILSSMNIKFHLFKGNTRKTLPQNISKLPKMDLVYIDGGHSYKTVKSDWENIKKLMHERTVVIFDDYNIDGVARAVNEITGYDVKILLLGIKKKQAIVRSKVA
jgi:predicted O-methyltransferase YrrM